MSGLPPLAGDETASACPVCGGADCAAFHEAPYPSTYPFLEGGYPAEPSERADETPSDAAPDGPDGPQTPGGAQGTTGPQEPAPASAKFTKTKTRRRLVGENR